MELSKLAPARGARKRRVRVGRGESSGCGKTCGRGGKGQTARKGVSIRAGFEGGQMPLYRRLPKYGFVSRQRVFGTNIYKVVNLQVLNTFEDGSTVDEAALNARGYKCGEHLAGIKVLGSGKLTKRLTVKVSAISASARAQVESLGGKVELIQANLS